MIFEYFEIFHEDKSLNIKILSYLISATGSVIILNTYLNGKISLIFLLLILFSDQIYHYFYWFLIYLEQKENIESYSKSISHFSSEELDKKVKSTTEIEMEKLRQHLIRNSDLKSKISSIYNVDSRFKNNILLNNFLNKTYDGHSYVKYDTDDEKDNNNILSYIIVFLFIVGFVFYFI